MKTVEIRRDNDDVVVTIASAARAAYTSEANMSLWCRKGEGWVKVYNANAAQT